MKRAREAASRRPGAAPLARRCLALALLSALASSSGLPGCEARRLEVLDGAGGGSAGAVANACPSTPGAMLCSELPRFDGVQVVDGSSDELCGVPTMVFRADDAAWKLNPELSFPEVAILRAFWSPGAFGLHVHVTDPRVVTSDHAVAMTGAAGVPDVQGLAGGDAVEIHLAASAALHGPINGSDDGGALQLVVAPPDRDHPQARAVIGYHPSPPGTEVDHLDVAPIEFAGRLVDDGYEIEVRVPWAPNASANLRPGSRVAFDFSLDIDDAATPGRQQQATLTINGGTSGAAGASGSAGEGARGGTGGNQTAAGASNCTPNIDPPLPFCDDRTWCTPVLQ